MIATMFHKNDNHITVTRLNGCTYTYVHYCKDPIRNTIYHFRSERNKRQHDKKQNVIKPSCEYFTALRSHSLLDLTDNPIEKTRIKMIENQSRLWIRNQKLDLKLTYRIQLPSKCCLFRFLFFALNIPQIVSLH